MSVCLIPNVPNANTWRKKMSKIYLICPVRNCSDEVKSQLDDYVAKLEEKGHDVHYPPRDVEQDQSGMGICVAHADAMYNCDEVHVWWDPDSTGSHFDLGMAFMLYNHRGIRFVVANDFEKTSHKSYGNVLLELSVATF